MKTTKRIGAGAAIASAVFEALERRRLMSGGSGALDLSFGQGGLASVAGERAAYADASAFTADGKIVIVGRDTGAGGPGTMSDDFDIARLNADGSPDTIFGGGRIVTTDFGGDDEAYCVAVGADGRIVVAGGSDQNLAVARYNADASLDTTFGQGGKLTLPIGSYAQGVALLPDGRILVSGNSADSVFVARLRADGSLDPTFGHGGVTAIDARWNVGLRVLPDGRILSVDTDSNDAGDFVQFDYVSADGRSVAEREGPVEAGASLARVFAVQADGRVVVGNSAGMGSVERFNADGSLDATFDNNDVAVGLFDVEALFVTADGKILAAGSTGQHRGVEQLNADGSLDASFGAAGIAVAPRMGPASGVGVDAAGDVLLVGGAQIGGDGGQSVFAATRFLAHRGVTAGTAQLDARSLTAAGQTDFPIRVTFRGGSGAAIDTSTLGGAVSLDGPDSSRLSIKLKDVADNGDGSFTAAYDVARYDGKRFTYLEDGAYTVSLNAGSALDANGVPVATPTADGSLGQFHITIAPPPAGTLPPAATVDAPYITAPATMAGKVTITFSGHDGIDASSVPDFLNVNGPDGSMLYALAEDGSQTTNADGSVTVIYDLTKPDGTQFTPDDNGRYTIGLFDPVLDNDGTPMAAYRQLGVVRVEVSPAPPGAVAPTAGGMQVSDGTDPSTRTLTVTYRGAAGVAIAQQTLNDGDLTVTDGNGASYATWFNTATTNADGSVTATYTVQLVRSYEDGLAAGDQAQWINGGTVSEKLTVSVNDAQVSDAQGSTVPATTLGAFNADVSTSTISTNVITAFGQPQHRRHHHHRYGHAHARHRSASASGTTMVHHGARTAAGHVG